AHRHGRGAGDLQPQRRDRRPPLPPGAPQGRPPPEPPSAAGGEAEGAAEPRDLLTMMRAHDVEIVTIGQYLRPSLKHHPLIRFVPPEEFAALREFGLRLGFE